MKIKIKTLILAVAMGFVAVPVLGGYPVFTVTLKPAIISPMPDPDYNEEEEGGKHIPPRPVLCTIDPTAGIQFVGMEKPEILTFEIYDLSGACVAVFGDEAAFLDFLFAQSGEYQIRLVTASWAYVGYIGV